MLLSIIIVLIAVSVHEFAHAWAADYLGDPTAKLEGRLTLNPLAHLDPIGTLTLFLFGFGWGKPVPVDSYNLKNPRRDEALISLAGPLSNIIIALLVGLAFKFIPIQTLAANTQPLISFLAINLGLAYFNLLPFPPLDGSKIFLALLPFEQAIEAEETLSQYGIILLLMSFLPIFNGRSLIDLILGPLVQISLQILI
jgi:Zn-dependent protease